MTERQDLRPLSTEDLLPDRDHTRTDDQYRTDEYRDADTTGAVDPTERHDHDGTGSVVHDQYDQVDVDAEHRADDGTEQRYDEQPATLDGTHDGTSAHDETVYDETADHDGTVDHDGAVQDETVVAAAADDETARQKPTPNADLDTSVALFSDEEVDQFRTEWRGLQSDFVDSPRDAVQHADQLVAQVIQSLATTFADHKKSLEDQWSKGEQVETEELRLALRQYRAFFDKLLTVG